MVRARLLAGPVTPVRSDSDTLRNRLICLSKRIDAEERTAQSQSECPAAKHAYDNLTNKADAQCERA